VEQEEQQALAILRGGFYPGPPAQPSQSRASKAIAGPLLTLLACPGRGTQSRSLAVVRPAPRRLSRRGSAASERVCRQCARASVPWRCAVRRRRERSAGCQAIEGDF